MSDKHVVVFLDSLTWISTDSSLRKLFLGTLNTTLESTVVWNCPPLDSSLTLSFLWRDTTTAMQGSVMIIWANLTSCNIMKTMRMVHYIKHREGYIKHPEGYIKHREGYIKHPEGYIMLLFISLFL